MQKVGLLTYLIASLIAMVGLPARAVMPPYHEALAALNRVMEFQTLRSRADHVVNLEVTNAQFSRIIGNQCPSREDWVIEAKVISIVRGEIAPGNTLRIQYTRNLYRCPGPIREEIPELKLGQRVEAYLNCQTNQNCVPAALAGSFVDEVTLQALVVKRREDYEREAAKEKGPNLPPDFLQRDNAIYFRRASFELQPSDHQLLRLHVQYLAKEPRVHIRLLSYAEPTMSRESAFVISEKRAMVVQRLLVDSGVSPSRIVIMPLGLERNPPPPSVKTNTSLQGVVVIDYGL
ncbi:MAG: hypothetical protein E6Q78_10020 [Rhodoferax sp.]|nr:MAG: hypothetical protein E6Q78_10020 [Rhodoferax sp.]